MGATQMSDFGSTTPPDFRLLFESAPGLYAVLDRDLRVVAVTDSYLRAGMARRDDLIGRPLAEAFPENPDDSGTEGWANLRASLQRVLRTGSSDAMPVQRWDIRLDRDDDASYVTRFWSVVNSPIIGADGSVHFVLHRVEDVTEFTTGVGDDAGLAADLKSRVDAMAIEVYSRSREAAAAHRRLKEANADLAELYEKTRELARAKSEFFAAVSNELRTPLTLVLAPVERLLDSLDGDDPRRADVLTVQRNAQLLLANVTDLLDASSIDSGELHLDYSEVDLGELTRVVVAFFGSLATDQDVTVDMRTEPGVRGQVDQEQLKRVLSSLLAHAFEFTPRGGRIRVELQRDGNRARFRIADSGPPLAGDPARAFDRFRYSRVASGAPRLTKAGLGLSIAHDLVVMHRGTITAEVAPEGGALFTVTLPLQAPADTVVRHVPTVDEGLPPVVAGLAEAIAPGEGAPPAAGPTGPSDQPLVLVVEDNPELNALVADSLSGKYRVVSTFDGRAGLAAAREHLPDLVISDVMMPGASGDELVAEVRADRALSTTPVLMLSARADEQTRLGLLRLGVNDFLVKPFAISELRARVDNLISVRQAEVRLQALRVTNDRDRIARDLHDVVIQRLFAIGMRLDAVQRYTDQPAVQARIGETIDDLDGVIRDIRSTIFDLQHVPTGRGAVRSQVMALATEAAERMGTAPRVRFDGPVDAVVHGAIASNLVAVLQEALSNTVRHAYASKVEVEVIASSAEVALTVTDDGVGPKEEPSGGNGLRNMVSRAEALGGTCTVLPHAPLGTRVRWVVPLR